MNPLLEFNDKNEDRYGNEYSDLKTPFDIKNLLENLNPDTRKDITFFVSKTSRKEYLKEFNKMILRININTIKKRNRK